RLDRDRRLQHVPRRLQGLPHELCLRPVLPHRRRRPRADPRLHVDPAAPRGARGVSVTLDRPATLTMRSASRHRLWRGVAQVATYLGLAAALVFFLGPFFWIVTTSLKGNEDFFAYPPVWIPSDPSLSTTPGCSRARAGSATSATA